jgi:hypothetical protein
MLFIVYILNDCSDKKTSVVYIIITRMNVVDNLTLFRL